MDSITKEVNESLKPLFERAKKEDLMFYNHYSDYLLPWQLKGWQKKGSFIWGAANWKLVTIDTYCLELEKEIKAAESKLASFLIKVMKQRELNEK